MTRPTMVGIAAREKEECIGMGGDPRPRYVNGE
jgi:hypothetical protein